MAPKSATDKAKKAQKNKQAEEVKLDFDEGEEEENVEMDYLLDLNENFFTKASKIIKVLMEHNRSYEAAKIKKYVDIIFHLHNKYADEVKKNAELQPLAGLARTKLGLALELTTSSEETVLRLKDALTKAWEESDASVIREQDVQQKMQELLIKCESFEKKDTEKGDDNAEFGQLAKYKNIILRERDRLNGDVMDLEKRLQMQRFYSEQLEYVVKVSEQQIAKMSKNMQALESDKQSIGVKYKNMSATLEDMKEVLTKTNQKLDHTNIELNETQTKLTNKTAEFNRQRMLCEKIRSEGVMQKRQLTKYEEEIAQLKKEQENNEESLRTMRLEDKVKNNLISGLNKKYKKAMDDQNTMSTNLYKMNRENHSLHDNIARLKNQVNSLEKDMLNARLQYDELRRLKDNLQHERDNLRRDIIRLNTKITDLRHTISRQTNRIDDLRLDISKLHVKLDEGKAAIAKAERERNEIAQEADMLNDRLDYQQDQLKLKIAQITELSEKLENREMALIDMKKQLDTMHTQKIALSRTYEVCAQERDNFRALHKKTEHQIMQLTNELQADQNKFNSLNLRIEHLIGEKKDLEGQLKNKETILNNVRKELKDVKQKNGNLLKTIDEDGLRLMKMSTDLEEARKEKNLNGLQMVRRNDEIMLLKEKMDVMQMSLDQGIAQYNQRVEDIRLLKTEIVNLQTERDCLSRAMKSTADMRAEIIRLQRTLNQERLRLRALIEDTKIPTGLHRWRILKGEDPSRLELLNRVQAMQRRYLKQEDEKANLKEMLNEANNVTKSLKSVIENITAPSELKEKLVATQRINRVQQRKLKALKAELAVQTIEVQARECVIDNFKDNFKESRKDNEDINVNINDNFIQTSSEALPVLQND